VDPEATNSVVCLSPAPRLPAGGVGLWLLHRRSVEDDMALGEISCSVKVACVKQRSGEVKVMCRRAVLLAVLLLLTGCEKGDQSVHQAGQRVGETLTDFTKGVGSGVDNRLDVPVELGEEVVKLGLRTTVAKSDGLENAGKKSLTVYFISSEAVNTWLQAKALNKEGVEVGRSTVEVDLAADDAKYVTFEFDPEMDAQRVTKYLVGIGKPVPPKPEEPVKETPVKETPVEEMPVKEMPVDATGDKT
jgi:hypothetical protein